MSPLLHLFIKDTQILLTYSAPHILLKCYYDGVAASIGVVIEKWPVLIKLHDFFPKSSDKQSAIPVDKLDQIRELLLDLQKKIPQQGKLQITIDNTVLSFVVRNNPPEDFIVRYEREGDHLNRILPKSVNETDDGWMLRGYEFWNYPDLDKKSLRKFQKSVIEQNDLLLYTRNYFPVFRHAGVRIESDIEYVNTPSVILTLHSIHYNHINIRPIWYVSPDSIDEMFSIPYHVVSGGTLREGLSPWELKEVLADVRKDTELEDDRIAEFHEHQYPIWKKWINGETANFERMHRWIKPPFYWILQVQSKLIQCVGKAYASPIACIDRERLQWH